jgi:hypothetical protein
MIVLLLWLIAASRSHQTQPHGFKLVRPTGTNLRLNIAALLPKEEVTSIQRFSKGNLFEYEEILQPRVELWTLSVHPQTKGFRHSYS